MTKAIHQFQLIQPKMQNLSKKAFQVSQILKQLDESLTDFILSVTDIADNYSPNNNTTSLQNLVRLIFTVESAQKPSFQKLSESYGKLSFSLVDQFNWEETVSTVNAIKEQQLLEINNIHVYRSLTQFVAELREWDPTPPIFITEPNIVKSFVYTADRLVKERKKDLDLEFKKTLHQAVLDDGRPPTMVPSYIERVMYQLYYDTKDMEGAFRVCSGKTEMDEYVKYLNVIDIRRLGSGLLSGIIKKFVRESTTPIWPEVIYDQLLDITKQFSNNVPLWKMRFRNLYNGVQPENKAFIEKFISLLLRVINNKTSKMDYSGMSTCVAVGLIRRSECDYTVSIQNIEEFAEKQRLSILAFKIMLEHANDLFTVCITI
ncbi:hypothetical protein EIN_129300 [Entamoeba invadens IP1]|uniref:Rho-GAP domain-containing protein n=1 Tax=Entamoeba invadens IP1 TaxID=370355 RepID=L7FPL9_ENTIV|nr:hypothetical protein EIN_129300 [Entamoeba invadens IP1]ELP91590.1 hypothetical protein EIN_129300 [Entamoeba invadens IP1]|eukprot:XP_004258361.1 hypothetical protein EIN_129300 [Entamoeba invadens IP1]